jgi:hypothetical protein
MAARARIRGAEAVNAPVPRTASAATSAKVSATSTSRAWSRRMLSAEPAVGATSASYPLRWPEMASAYPPPTW